MARMASAYHGMFRRGHRYAPIYTSTKTGRLSRVGHSQCEKCCISWASKKKAWPNSHTSHTSHTHGVEAKGRAEQPHQPHQPSPWRDPPVPAAAVLHRHAQGRIGGSKEFQCITSAHMVRLAASQDSPHMGNEPLGAQHVIAIRLAKVGAQRLFLDVYAPRVADTRAHHDRQQRRPVGHRHPHAEEHQQCARIRRVANQAIWPVSTTYCPARVATVRVKNLPSTRIAYQRNASPASISAMPIQNCSGWFHVKVVPGKFALTRKNAANTPTPIAMNNHACEPRSRLTAPFSTFWKNVPSHSGAKHTNSAT